MSATANGTRSARNHEAANAAKRKRTAGERVDNIFIDLRTSSSVCNRALSCGFRHVSYTFRLFDTFTFSACRGTEIRAAIACQPKTRSADARAASVAATTSSRHSSSVAAASAGRAVAIANDDAAAAAAAAAAAIAVARAAAAESMAAGSATAANDRSGAASATTTRCSSSRCSTSRSK